MRDAKNLGADGLRAESDAGNVGLANSMPTIRPFPRTSRIVPLVLEFDWRALSAEKSSEDLSEL